MNEPTWARVELMGHLTLAGRLTEEERFGSKLGRVDIPQEDGTFCTQYFGGASVYRITVISEAVARHLAKTQVAPPVSPWDFPKQLAAPATPWPDRVMPCGHTPENCDCDMIDDEDDEDQGF